MSGIVVHLKKSDKYGWWFSWGNETFYNENRELVCFDRSKDAVDWIGENHPNLILVIPVARIFDENPKSEEPSKGQLQLW